jgi:hypothetical protein
MYSRRKTAKENLQTKDYLDELSSVTGIPVSELFNPIIGGKYPGTWVHRKVGYHLAQWISPCTGIFNSR